MANKRLVTVIGATGAQGGAVVQSLIQTGKYQIRGLTRDAKSEKALSVAKLSDQVEMATCDINKREDLERAFKDSWAVYALTNFSIQPEVEIQQGKLMADVTDSLKIPYLIFSTLENVDKLSNGQLNVPHFTQKALIRDYIKEKHPNLKVIYVQSAFYMQNWQNRSKPQKLPDGTIVFASPLDQKATLHIGDADDTGPIVREILENPEKLVGQDICICSEEICFEDISKVFTKVTGIPSISKTLTEEEFRGTTSFLPKLIQDDLFYMYKWFEQYGCFGKHKDWTTGKQLTHLNTFEDWLKKTGWKGQ
ncbi:unnamed protein product [Adineta ricciae]|uniref:NmrA-like family domain-containing protein 1 n=1 Tax=Adineta ricciae TaxID=249248 RepID=A0A814K5K7_ADIRI|nr:unnamed protein product [Adineta ricciae]CAF1276303.1 unnamed protein product [Adineta ricciae]